ncbi:MAG: TrmH family RNA methyltransferase [Candidatus Pelagisphaera sp.]|mgnify:CR=1 FL=1|jgi:TrmH family RNA methyltransferase
MLEAEQISSLQNDRIKNLVKLRNRRSRDQQGIFLAEGYRAISRALEKDVIPTEIYFSPDWFLGENETALLEEAQSRGAKLFEISKIAFEKIAYRERPEGLTGVIPQWNNSINTLKLSKPPFLLIVESIEKPGNLGTILRSADAAGVDAVICCDSVTDLFNPNVVRSSTGVLFSMPTIMTTSDETIEWLRENGIRSIAATPHASQLYTETNLTGPVAIIMGSEQFGLSEKWLEACDEQTRIPMAGQADSLNVAMATLVTLFEAVRQRAAPK